MSLSYPTTTDKSFAPWLQRRFNPYLEGHQGWKMNFYMESVALLWSTAMRAAPATRPDESDMPERIPAGGSVQAREGAPWGGRLRAPQGTVDESLSEPSRWRG